MLLRLLLLGWRLVNLRGLRSSLRHMVLLKRLRRLLGLNVGLGLGLKGRIMLWQGRGSRMKVR